MIICYSDVVIDCTYQVLHVYHHFLFLKVYGVQTDSNKVHNFLVTDSNTTFVESIDICRTHKSYLPFCRNYLDRCKRVLEHDNVGL